MAWDFSTDHEYAEQLEWVREFVREECEPLDLIIEESHDLNDPVRQALIPPLQAIVRERGLWAAHLPPELGEKLVDVLTATAPLILFSAAQPGQGRFLIGQPALKEAQRTAALGRPFLQHIRVNTKRGVVHRFVVRAHAGRVNPVLAKTTIDEVLCGAGQADAHPERGVGPSGDATVGVESARSYREAPA